MIIVISPAKTLDFESKINTTHYSQASFLKEAGRINAKLRKLRPSDLMQLQGISAKLAEMNAERNRQWHLPFTPENARQAVFAFNGDVYGGLDATSFTEEDLDVAQEKIRILSGLYGLLRPLDLIQPYRLEMGTRFALGSSNDLYAFWRKRISTALGKELSASGRVLLNLASHEYFRAIDPSKIKAKVITPQFLDKKDGQYKMISFFAKRARGLMSRFIVTNRISEPQETKAFDMEGYHFNNYLSTEQEWVFTRER